MNPIIECVPNFSEGRNLHTLSLISEAIRSVSGVKLLHVSRGEAANRTVFTFAGHPDDVVEAAYRAIEVAVTHIDMRQHKGTHPRLGAVDVCPFVPVQDISIEQTNIYVKALAKRIATDFEYPIYLYEHSASSPERRKLEYHRSGEYEKLAHKLAHPAHQPDEGKAIFVPKTGATVMGVRDFLVAFNVNLATNDVSIAREIAAQVRESGKKINENGVITHQAGKCRGVKAIGWFIEDFRKVQVSMNLTDLKATPTYRAFEEVKKLAHQFGTAVTGSELIGLIPLSEMVQAGRYFMETYEGQYVDDETIHIQKAISYLGLDELEKFVVTERILEYALNLKHFPATL